jgi:hypothetical protein
VLKQFVDPETLFQALEAGATIEELALIYRMSTERMRQLLRPLPGYSEFLKRNRAMVKEEEFRCFLLYVERKGFIPRLEDVLKNKIISKSSHYYNYKNKAEEKGFVYYMEVNRQKKKQAMLEHFKKLALKLGKTPSRTDLERDGKFTQGQMKFLFGDLRIAQAQAGLAPNTDGNRPGTYRGKVLPKDAFVNDLKRIAKKLGRKPTWKEVERYGKYCRSSYRRHGRGNLNKYVRYLKAQYI